MRQFQLMRQTTSVEICWQQGREEGSKDVEWVWLFGGCVVSPIQEMRLAVSWVAFYTGIVQCVRSVAMWVMIVGWVAGFRWRDDT